ncbi:uncharacterized protein YeaO (DUF488 family) [Paraburkholderia sp. GAS448]|uniref:DUF488 domain-containing protein n=1 Tax=Paraburkholderia sp. GAS448 TaxID=3035136 RepID=UPI003D24842A
MPHTNRKSLKIFIRRAYDDPTQEDGYRVLVDRVWPRGRSKETLKLDEWVRELAPGTELRKWFGHDPQRWEAFQQRYRSELDSEEMQARMRQLLSDAGGQPITLVYGARDEEHNQAIVLRDVLLRLSGG